MEFKEHRFEIKHSDIFSKTSRWHLFWDLVIKKKSVRLDISLNPPETEVNIDYVGLCIEGE